MLPFVIAIDDTALKDLHRRLDHVRWPSEPQVKPWTLGADLMWMREVAHHWRHAYDWRRWEARLNSFSNYKASLGGRDVHFILEPGSGVRPLPLLLTHGWPGSIVEFIDVIEELAHPERFGGKVDDAFTVVVPSLPGYGFSDTPESPVAPPYIATLWSRLMRDVLGYRHYVAQGGDWGGIVTAWMGLRHPQHLAAIHLNIAALRAPNDPSDPFSPEELAWLKLNRARRADLSGYSQIQATRPQTLSYGLTDSPIGLAAWILEKFHDWTILGEEAPPPFDLDHLLTNVMLYWIGGINAANWLYVSLSHPSPLSLGQRVEVPTGFMLCGDDIVTPPPDRWLRRTFNMVHRRDLARGGHFLAMEQGPLFVQELREFFRPYR